MDSQLVHELISWTLNAALKPNMQELQNIKEKASQANDVQLVKFCNLFAEAIQTKQPIHPIFQELLTANNKSVIERTANSMRTSSHHFEDSKDLEH